MLCNLLILSLVAPTYFPSLRVDTDAAESVGGREARLATLVEKLEEARVSDNIPGMSLAVVMDGEVVLTHGFGLADIDEERPVTADTLFAIGSTTKAFTATLVGMLVEDGALGWDDPVSKYLPFFELDTGDSGAKATMRDMLCHRSGFTRMPMLSGAHRVTRERILKTAAGAEPWAPFRKEFHYSNIMFLAAGVAAGQAADSTWDELVRTRIFEPLGMSSSVTTFDEAQAAPELASGYSWDKDAGEHDARAMVDIDGIGPAGSIVSSAEDMARWVRFQLAHGAVDGQQLIEAETLKTTWTSQIEVGGGVGYGLGWMVRDWNGQPLIEHGGNIDGYAAQVGLLPEAGVGYALLTNVSVTPLQGGSLQIVFETLLGDEPEELMAADSAGEPSFDDYLGRYTANFSTFKDATFTVQVKDDKLAVDVPGQMVYTLKAPNDEGKWVFEITDQISVSFDHDEAGEVVGMRMYQGGLTFELPREGVEIAAEIPLDELQRFLGDYRAEGDTFRGKVLIQNNRLAVDVPGQMVYELHPPDDEELWRFRVKHELAVSFAESDDGHVESLTFHQPEGEMTLQRLVDADAVALPTVDELVELRDVDARLAALRDAGTLRCTGTARFVHSGLEGEYEMLVDGAQRYCEAMDFGDFGGSRTVSDSTAAFTEDSLRGVTDMNGDALALTVLGHPVVQSGDWREHYDSVRVVGLEEADERHVAVVRLKKGDLPTTTLHVDLETGDVVYTESVAPSEFVQIPLTTRFGDFRELGGIRTPFHITIENEWSGRLEIQLEDIESGVAIDPAAFAKPE